MTIDLTWVNRIGITAHRFSQMCISRFLGTFLLFFPNIVNVAYVDNFNLIT